MASMKIGPARPVIVTTEYKGVFFGYAEDTAGDRIQLKDARMVLRWGGTSGFMRLAETGPDMSLSDNISSKADIEVRKITSVAEVTPAALKAWESLK